MAKRLCRKELYDLVWSKPMKTLSAQFGISDVALKKTCETSSNSDTRPQLLGKKGSRQGDVSGGASQTRTRHECEVFVASGGNYWYQEWTEKELLGPLPSPPEFPEPIEAEWIAKVVGEGTVPHKIHNWHPKIDCLLKE